MSTITATVAWSRDPESPFTDNRYPRAHHWRFDGGAEIAASSSPDIVPIPMSDPAAVDPEEAFVASISSCHMLWFLAIAAKHGFVVDGYTDDAEAALAKNENGRLVVDVVTLRPKVTWNGKVPTAEEATKLHDRAHQECFIANSVKSTVNVEPQ